jgi:hypothetical protein
MQISSVETSFTSTSSGILRDSATSAMRSTKSDLLTVYGMLVMCTIVPVFVGAASFQVPRSLSEPWPVS